MFLNNKIGFVKPGSKADVSSKPQLTCLTGYNHFKLNKAALTSMGIDVGDGIVLFDMSLKATAQDVAEGYATEVGEPINAPDENHRFFITPAFYLDGEYVGSKIGKTSYGLSYATVWGAVQLNELGMNNVTKKDMLDAEIIKQFTSPSGAKRYRANQKITYNVVPVYKDSEGNSTLEDTGDIYEISEINGVAITNKKGKETSMALYALTARGVEVKPFEEDDLEDDFTPELESVE